MSAVVLFGISTLPFQATILTNIRVVFVIMLISSIAFYVMAFRVPVVSLGLLAFEAGQSFCGDLSVLTHTSKNACSIS